MFIDELFMWFFHLTRNKNIKKFLEGGYMPSNYQMGLSVPTDYSEFENMVRAFFNNKYTTVQLRLC